MLFRLILLSAISFFCCLQGDPPVQIPITHRILQFENEYVKVWKTVIMPNQPLTMHRHDASRVVVGLQGGSLTKIEETGETSELKFETGCAYWLPADPPDTRHGDVNTSDEPIVVMVIEMKEKT